MDKKKGFLATIWESMTKTGGCCGGGGCCGPSNEEDAEAVEKKEAGESEN
ncbi:MAG: hypothetical protein IH624_11120 [Phycisphaerae bacterium]|nr:hypothetical protein [Phycisphaerae bacterium]